MQFRTPLILKTLCLPRSLCLFLLAWLAIIVLSALPMPVGATHAERLPSDQQMNGIRLADYVGFEKKWKQITVRFRTDSGELRFTYANPIALRALQQELLDYPDGAVFAKIGAGSQDDPDFSSSKLPAGVVRYQFMVRNKKRYASTDGWGYALFAPGGSALENPSETAKACHACHTSVIHRGYVFSEIANLDSALGPRVPMKLPPAVKTLGFMDTPWNNLPKGMRDSLPVKVAAVRSLQGALTRNIFVGTLGEIVPALIKDVRLNKKPAALISATDEQFVIVFGAPESIGVIKPELGPAPACKDTENLFLIGRRPILPRNTLADPSFNYLCDIPPTNPY